MQGVGLFRAVDRIDQGVARIAALAADVPRAGDGRILCTNRAPCHPCGHGKHVAQKPVDVNGVYPRRAKAHFDLGGIQLFGLYPPQRFRIDGVFRRGLGRVFCLAQFPAHIAGQILVAGFPYMGDRILKDDAPQFICDFPFCFAAQRRHEFQVDARFSPMDSANASLAVSTLSTGSGLRIVRLVKISALRLSFPSSSSISREDSRL